ncbi:hypothetical protein BJX63DRAFT_416557 [Aspergillus granulosus]|uniref:Uncharacterized protein n=1 Tax=Aspergillus granulosus TaxID=176169 RepID=A0ABR4GRX4_9EURO
MPKTTGVSRPTVRSTPRKPERHAARANEQQGLSAHVFQRPLRTSQTPSTLLQVPSSSGAPSTQTPVTLESHKACFATVQSLEQENAMLKAENDALRQSLQDFKERLTEQQQQIQKFAQEVQTIAAGWLQKLQGSTEPQGRMEPVVSTMPDMWATQEGGVFNNSNTNDGFNSDDLEQFLQFE